LVHGEHTWERQGPVNIVDVLDETWFGVVESLKH
jgi:hypothetical protein